MFNIIESTKQKITQAIDWRKLEKQKDEELKVLSQDKQYETSKKELERQVELEKLKAEVRKEQLKSLPKGGFRAQEKKSAFASFQDYCTDFAQQQQQSSSTQKQGRAPSVIGGLGGFGMGGLVSPYDKPKAKKKHKRKHKQKQKVKMLYVPMNPLGNNIKTVWR